MSASTAVMKVTAAISPSPAYSWVLVTAVLPFCQLAKFSFAEYFSSHIFIECFYGFVQNKLHIRHQSPRSCLSLFRAESHYDSMLRSTAKLHDIRCIAFNRLFFPPTLLSGMAKIHNQCSLLLTSVTYKNTYTPASPFLNIERKKQCP
jgi:hypothetical protein